VADKEFELLGLIMIFRENVYDDETLQILFWILCRTCLSMYLTLRDPQAIRFFGFAGKYYNLVED